MGNEGSYSYELNSASNGIRTRDLGHPNASEREGDRHFETDSAEHTHIHTHTHRHTHTQSNNNVVWKRRRRFLDQKSKNEI